MLRTGLKVYTADKLKIVNVGAYARSRFGGLTKSNFVVNWKQIWTAINKSQELWVAFFSKNKKSSGSLSFQKGHNASFYRMWSQTAPSYGNYSLREQVGIMRDTNSAKEDAISVGRIITLLFPFFWRFVKIMITYGLNPRIKSVLV